MTIPSDPIRTDRRAWLAIGTAAAAGLSTWPRHALAQAATAAAPAPSAPRRFDPRPGDWRTFALTTRVEIPVPKGAAQVWIPLPSVDREWQSSEDDRWTGNMASARVVADGRYGARMLHAQFAESTARPTIEVTSVARTRNRAADWQHPSPAAIDPETLRAWTAPTELMPTDGIVRTTAREAIGDARTDEEKVRGIYDWIVSRTYREPAVRGCGVGDIRTMLETQNFGGKCGDINGLFVGLCRAAGVPARDLYGIRVAPSAFGYREVGANPAKLQSAQHCRAEVFLKSRGWTAMDPADVGKVMRLETPAWIRDRKDPIVAPVDRALFGGWEGNWVAYNEAHDVALPGSTGPRLGFLMYPQAEDANGRYDALDSESFAYTITAREIAG